MDGGAVESREEFDELILRFPQHVLVRKQLWSAVLSQDGSGSF